MRVASYFFNEPSVTRSLAVWLTTAVLALLFATGSSQASERKVLVMGDSLSAAYGIAAEQGWVSILEQRLQQTHPDWRMVNASVSGETTSGGASRIQAELDRHRPEIVIIELGANDGLRGLPLELARANLERMTKASLKAGAQVGLIGMRLPPNYGPAYAGGFEAMFAEIADQHELPLLPFLLEPIAERRDAFQPDNLHPTADVQTLLADHVWPMLRTLLSQSTQAAEHAGAEAMLD